MAAGAPFVLVPGWWLGACAKQRAGFLAGYNELRNIDWVDLPTSHWPMFSKPRELADILGEIAKKAGGSDS